MAAAASRGRPGQQGGLCQLEQLVLKQQVSQTRDRLAALEAQLGQEPQGVAAAPHSKRARHALDSVMEARSRPCPTARQSCTPTKLQPDWRDQLVAILKRSFGAKEALPGPEVGKHLESLQVQLSPYNVHVADMRRTAAALEGEVAVSLDKVVDTLLQERGRVLLPTEFRDATEEDELALPKIIAAFLTHLRKTELKESSQKAYSKAIRDLFCYDWKPAEIMASHDYLQFVLHTFEDAICNNFQSAALKRFAVFWEEHGNKEFAELSLPLDLAPPVRKARQDLAMHGDDSAGARAKFDLPEGWRVHLNQKEDSRVVGCTSPNGRLYRRKHEMDLRLDRFTPQKPTRPEQDAPAIRCRSMFEFMRPREKREPDGEKSSPCVMEVCANVAEIKSDVEMIMPGNHEGVWM